MGSIIVLIDTWWNVNQGTAEEQPKTGGVLIDTWWNVNMHQKRVNRSLWSFNRYMVECKSILLLSHFDSITCFNRYMVECKYDSNNCFQSIRISFNRYMVECKLNCFIIFICF